MNFLKSNHIYFLLLLALCLVGVSSCTHLVPGNKSLSILEKSNTLKVKKNKKRRRKRRDYSHLKVYVTMKDWRNFLKTKQLSASEKGKKLYNLNSKELVNLYKIKNVVPAKHNLAKTMKQNLINNGGIVGFLAALNKSFPHRDLNDNVSRKMASNSKNKSTAKNDDLVFFKYLDESEAGIATETDNQVRQNPLNAKNDLSKISDRVHRVIQREMQNKSSKGKVQPSATYQATVDKIVASYKNQTKDKIARRDSALKKNNITKQGRKEDVNPFPEPDSFLKSYSKSIIRVQKIILSGKPKIEEQRNFHFIPNYNQNLTWKDTGEGFIEIAGLYKNDYATLGGTLVGSDFKKVNISLAIEAEDRVFDILTLENRDFDKFLEAQKLRGLGGHVLVQLRDDIEDVDLGEVEYETRFYFDEKFNLLKNIENASFILFVGVDTGTTLMGYKHLNGHVAEKIILVVDDEVYYDDGLVQKGKRAVFSIWETNILGSENRELNIDGNLINYFNRNTKARNLALNHYEINMPYLAYGSRSYIRLGHITANMFVGNWNLENLYVPSREFVVQVLNSLEVEELEGRCLIHVNLSFAPKSIEVDTKTGSGSLSFNETFLDNTGLFSGEVTPLTKKVFIIGEGKGLVNIKVEYLDGEIDYLESYCSKDSYLIEQI